MIESGITEGINKFFYLLKLSVYFWGISLVGGLFFGMGPAFLSIMTLYREDGWDYKEITLKRSFSLFKANFAIGNQLFYAYALVIGILFLSLYTSSQLTGVIFLMIDFMLAVLLVIMVVSWFFANALLSVFDISLKNVMKLATILFFKEFKGSVSIVIVIVLLAIVALKMPAMIFFAGAGSLAFFLSRLGQKLDNSLTFE